MVKCPPVIGENVDVVVAVRGNPAATSQGTIVLEDLSGVLTRIASRNGPNGPNGEVTQWILAQASRQFASGLKRDLEEVSESGLSRVLSAIVGHQPFVKNVLGLSVHHMDRRWPQATDWYSDLVAYILRPESPAGASEREHGRLEGLEDAALGTVVTSLAEAQLRRLVNADEYRLPELVTTMWPHHPLVVKALAHAQTVFRAAWEPVFELLLTRYGLRFRDGVTMAEMSWALQSMVTFDIRELTSNSQRPGYIDPTDGRTRPWSSRGIMVYLVGALETEEGRTLSLHELYQRLPSRASSPISPLSASMPDEPVRHATMDRGTSPARPSATGRRAEAPTPRAPDSRTRPQPSRTARTIASIPTGENTIV